MFEWPKLELTDHERQYVRPYKTAKYPGVLRRTYERTISNNPDIPQSTGLMPSANIQISRRARVFGLTFSGGVSNTRLQITNASGTLYTVNDTRTQLPPYVSALVGGSPYMRGSYIGGKFDPIDQGTNLELLESMILLSGEYGALLIEPNWVLMPNETLIFNGDWSDISVEDNITVVLNIAIHVWEFPVMGNAEKAVREVV